MHVLGIVGQSDDETAALVERLCRRLTERGRVATITCAPETDGTDRASLREAGAEVSYAIGADGWVAAGEQRGLDETLAELALAYDYALVAGATDARLPTVSLGGCEHVGEEIATAEHAADIDLDALVATLEDGEPYETLASLVARVKQSADSDRAGAIATFTGRVREHDDPDDPATEYLEFEKYEGVADERMAAISAELEARDGVFEVALYHRTGVVEAGEDIVFVVVLAGHRREAFRTVEDGIDRLKDEVPLFKKEVTVADAVWAHER